MDREEPLPWIVFVGASLTILSLITAFLLNVTVLGQSIKASNPGLPPYGRELLQPLANVAAVVVLIVGIVLIYVGSKKT